MRILQVPNTAIPSQAPVAHSADAERLESLEKVVKSILQKIQDIEIRIKALEGRPKNSSFRAVTGGPDLPSTYSSTGPSRPSSASTGGRDGESIRNDGPPTKTFGGDVKNTPSVTLDADALKKGLLTKMWKYLNDQAAA